MSSRQNHSETRETSLFRNFRPPCEDVPTDFTLSSTSVRGVDSMTSTVPRHLRLVPLIFVTVLLVCRSGFSLDNSEIKVLRFLTSSSVRIQVGKEATLVRVGDKVGIVACVAL